MCSEIDLYRQYFTISSDNNDIVRIKPAGSAGVGAVKIQYDKDGYRVARVGGKLRFVHRIIYALHHGVLPALIDHINGDRADNHISNLREASHSMNMQNMRPRNRDLPMGVQRGHKSPNYTAWISVAGKTTYLGTYPTPEEAHRVYLTHKRNLHEGCTI